MTAKRHVGRPRGGDPVQTRRAILDAAEECFAASGFAGATTRQVAGLAGVNVATLHYHFGGKEKLYRAVLDEAIREDVFSHAGGALPAASLSAAVEALWDFGVAHPSLPRLRLFHRLSGSVTPAGTFEMPEDPRAAYLERTLAETGAKTPLPPAQTARVILALLDGALVAAQRGRQGEESAPFGAGALRAAVVAAALRVASTEVS
ncbi:MAG TPA: TetR/AcrR family transcriptional regulator [Thermoanaerobaculia bacterium]|nr:TetR/AcrR family transcriptional regulator [Thermoanaerobaculia bacterium]